MTPRALELYYEAEDCLVRARLTAPNYYELFGRAAGLLWLCSLALAAGY